MDRRTLFGMVLVAVLGLSTVQTKNCCAPDQWQGLLSKTSGVSKNGQGTLTTTVSYIYYDYTNLRYAAFVNFTDSAGHVYSFKQLLLYNKPNNGTSYHLDFKTRKCWKNRITFPFIRYCIPDSAQKVKDLTLGAATESLPVTVYSLTKQNTTIQQFITVTQKQCIPVSEVVLEKTKTEEAMGFSGYGNIQLKILQPSVFDVPPECRGATPFHSDKIFPEVSAKSSFTSYFLYM